MRKRKVLKLLALAGPGLLLLGGCSLNGWWPWAVGAGLLLALNQN